MAKVTKVTRTAASKTAQQKNIVSALANKNSRTAIFVVVALLVGLAGAFAVTKSNAQVISGTSTVCGSSYGVIDQYGYGTPTVHNLTYSGKLRNSDSVRNLAKFICSKGHLDQKTALSVNKSGTWSNKLTSGIRAFEKADPRLAQAADGAVDARLICALGERKYFDEYIQKDRFSYGLVPVGFADNDCFRLLGSPVYDGK